MTRFARAKGSKSSNERLPNDATSWQVMKQQLAECLNQEGENVKKTKTARELLSENAARVENSNWAEFEDSTSKKVEKSNYKQNKLHNKVGDKISTNDACKINKTVKDRSVDKEESNIKDSTSDKVELNPAKTKAFQKRKKESDVNEESTKPKKRLKTRDKDDKQSKKNSSEKTSNPSEDKTDDKNSTQCVLSKRQKRNMKNKEKNMTTGNNNPQHFNVQGNDWNNSVNFGKRNRSEKSSDNFNTEEKHDTNNQRDGDNVGQPYNNIRNSGFVDRNFNKFNGKGPLRGPKVVKRKEPKIRDDKVHKRRKPEMPPISMTFNGVQVEIVSYDGFPVQKKDAERLKDLRQQMIMKGIPKAEVDAAMKLERRKAEKALTRIKKNVCYNCRKFGHNLSDCPELVNEQCGTGICFKCGSTEHTHFECKVNKSSGYRYATCFICREQGHISKQCPDNPRGVYPQGGACKICGDVTHLKKDCPDLIKEQEQSTITIEKITNNTESLEDDIIKRNTNSECKTNKKIVKF